MVLCHVDVGCQKLSCPAQVSRFLAKQDLDGADPEDAYTTICDTMDEASKQLDNFLPGSKFDLSFLQPIQRYLING